MQPLFVHGFFLYAASFSMQLLFVCILFSYVAYFTPLQGLPVEITGLAAAGQRLVPNLGLFPTIQS
jgi:hypothetical protein